MESVKEAQYLNIISLLVLFTTAPAAGAFGAVIVRLTSMYALLQSHKFDLIIHILNLMLMLLLSYLFFFIILPEFYFQLNHGLLLLFFK